MISSVSMSLEKRFMRRPTGVLSKNDMGVLITVSSKSVCITLEHVTQPIASTKVSSSTEATARRRSTCKVYNVIYTVFYITNEMGGLL